MGGVQSAPSKDEMPKVLNFILQEMFRRTDLADIYSLADPERCKRYIVVATDALESLFVKMAIRPEKKDGMLFFQSVEGLQRSMPADVRAKQREYCLELAFFFIRIFQIFGALFLSMYDSKLPNTDPYDDSRSSAARGVPFLNPKDFFGFSKPPESSSWFGAGGDLTAGRDGSFYISGNSPYSILNYHLISPGRQDITESAMKFSGSYSFTIAQNELYDITGSSRTLKSSLKPRITYYFERNSRYYQLSAVLNIEKIPADVYKVWLSDFQGDESGNFAGKTSVHAFLRPFTADGIPRTEREDTYKRNQTLPQVLTAMFDKVVIATLGEPPFSVVKYFRKLRYISGDNDRDQLITGTHIFVLRGQEDNDSAKITYQDNIKIEGESKKLKIENVIVRIKPDKSSLGFSYKLKLDFSMCNVSPLNSRNYIDIPTVVKEATFNSSSEDASPTMDKGNYSIPDYLNKIFTEIVSGARSDRVKGFQYTREGLVKPYDSDQIKSQLRVKKLWELMAKDPPIKSHCVARAVQLLSVDAISGNLSKQAFTSICQMKFPYVEDGSLPTPGEPIIGSAGVYSMSLLFFEGLENGAPKLLDSGEYKDYLRYLKYLFERYPSEDDIKDEPVVPGQVRSPAATPLKIDDIRETTLGLCKDAGGARLSLPRDLAGELRSVTQALFSQQRAHFQKAIGLVFSIFDQNSVEIEKKLKFNRRIITGGMNEINRIAAGTRDLLREYYKGCELTYRDGLLMIYNYEKRTGKKLESIPINSTGPTPTATAPPNNNNNNNL